MAWFYTVLGAAFIGLGLADMFQTLLHPSGRAGRLTGPFAIAAVVSVWTLLEVFGWALVCYRHIPAGFSYSPGIDPAAYPDFAEALYISLVTLATLGFGDVVPGNGWLRLLQAGQLLGAALADLARFPKREFNGKGSTPQEILRSLDAIR